MGVPGRVSINFPSQSLFSLFLEMSSFDVLLHTTEAPSSVQQATSQHTASQCRAKGLQFELFVIGSETVFALPLWHLNNDQIWLKDKGDSSSLFYTFMNFGPIRQLTLLSRDIL